MIDSFRQYGQPSMGNRSVFAHGYVIDEEEKQEKDGTRHGPVAARTRILCTDHQVDAVSRFCRCAGKHLRRH